ncbi:MAG: hypothetical protein ACJAXM_001168 [Arenicella sp.]|jgi:hypothetical protein
MLGLILVAIELLTLIEFIYYWLHRMQHNFFSGGASMRLTTTLQKWVQLAAIVLTL